MMMLRKFAKMCRWALALKWDSEPGIPTDVLHFPEVARVTRSPFFLGGFMGTRRTKGFLERRKSWVFQSLTRQVWHEPRRGRERAPQTPSSQTSLA